MGIETRTASFACALCVSVVVATSSTADERVLAAGAPAADSGAAGAPESLAEPPWLVAEAPGGDRIRSIVGPPQVGVARAQALEASARAESASGAREPDPAQDSGSATAMLGGLLLIGWIVVRRGV